MMNNRGDTSRQSQNNNQHVNAGSSAGQQMRFKANQYGSFAAANENSQSIRGEDEHIEMLRGGEHQDEEEIEEDEFEATHHQREVSQRIDHEVLLGGGKPEDNHK